MTPRCELRSGFVAAFNRNYAGTNPGKPGMNGFPYVYVLQSQSDPRRHYTGLTDDLHDRLRRHNAGECEHTRKHRPWDIRTATAFSDRARAAAFETYLKTHSGRVFASRHF